MLERLSEWGVKRIYGYPGDGINAMLSVFYEVENRIEFV
jgi:pyruvate dehydrogenase (quinone)